jgi:hypothetical protein
MGGARASGADIIDEERESPRRLSRELRGLKLESDMIEML